MRRHTWRYAALGAVDFTLGLFTVPTERPAMKPIFIALLHQVEIAEDLGSGDKVNDTLRITNNREVVSRLVPHPFRSILGEMEINSLLSGSPVVFAEAEWPTEMTPQQYLLTRLYEVQSFLMTTWVFQDNAINCELGFLLYQLGDVSTATSNFIAHLYSDCTAKKPITKLSRAQLRKMRALHRAEIQIPDHPFAFPTSQLTSAHPRLSRAFYIINAARGEQDIAIKVAHYCTAFETLFATSQTELAHQLSERIACYLFSGTEERLSAYRKIKSAYALRSKVVHGAALRDNKLEETLSAAVYCDGIARNVMGRLLTEPNARKLFEQSTESFDETMLRTIFGA